MFLSAEAVSEGGVIAERMFNYVYMYLDTAFLVALLAFLIVRKKYLTAIFGLFGGLLYFVIDFGIFHLATGSRHIEGGDMAAVLWWMSMSYGFTNFVWIWMWYSRDEHKFAWTALIVFWWFCCPMLAETFGQNSPTVHIWRETGAYHGYMALILFTWFAAAIVFNIVVKDKKKHFPLAWLFATGVAVQFGWEFMLLVGGIRSAQIVGSFSDKLMTLVVNSLLETNLGSVTSYVIYVAITAKLTENLKPNNMTFFGRMAELNSIPLFKRVKPVDLSADAAAVSSGDTVAAVNAAPPEGSPADTPPEDQKNP